MTHCLARSACHMLGIIGADPGFGKGGVQPWRILKWAGKANEATPKALLGESMRGSILAGEGAPEISNLGAFSCN